MRGRCLRVRLPSSVSAWDHHIAVAVVRKLEERPGSNPGACGFDSRPRQSSNQSRRDLCARSPQVPCCTNPPRSSVLGWKSTLRRPLVVEIIVPSGRRGRRRSGSERGLQVSRRPKRRGRCRMDPRETGPSCLTRRSVTFLRRFWLQPRRLLGTLGDHTDSTNGRASRVADVDQPTNPRGSRS
jgi:hypothetical protein